MEQHPLSETTPTSEWQPSHSGSLSRRLRGPELMVNYSERFNNGNYELTISASLQTPLTGIQLKDRCHAAWWQTRKRRPVVGIGVQLGQLDFEPIAKPGDAQRWAANTCIVATNATVEAVALACARQPLSTTSITLVIDPSHGSPGCVLNMSHALVNHEGYAIIAEFLSLLAQPQCERGIAAIFEPETTVGSLPKLPQSLSQAYTQRIPVPTTPELQDAKAIFQRAQERWARSSIGIPLHPDAVNRKSRVHNKLITLGPSLGQEASKRLRRMEVSITVAFFACITLAIAQRYGTGREQGAHLLFSANAGRWFDTQRQRGFQPVTMSIVPGGLWLDAKELDVAPTDTVGIVRLARAIQKAQMQDIASPHIIAVYDQLAPAMAEALRESQSVVPALPAVGRPTLTSQGRFDGHLPSLGHDDARDEFQMTDLRTGGRNTDPNVCFALYSFRDELRCNLLFDERFFDEDEVMQLAHEVTTLFRSFISSTCNVVLAKV